MRTGSKGGAAFAFASAMGVKLLAAEPVFQKFLNASELVAVVGLDAITDLNAIKALKKLGEKHPNFKPKLFLHHTAGSCFHPKTMWLRTAKGGVTITGSGNLTTGGLKGNWEAMTIETLSPAEIDKVEKAWDKWIAPHKKELLELDDPKAIRKVLNRSPDRTARHYARGVLRIAERISHYFPAVSVRDSNGWDDALASSVRTERAAAGLSKTSPSRGLLLPKP
jgi:PLD-like domain